MTYQPPYSEETKAAAVKAYRECNGTLSETAKQFGVSTTTLKMWVNPEYARKRKDQINEARRVVPDAWRG